MTNSTAQQFLSALRTYIGVRESPLGSNRTRVGVEFGWNGVAWCQETMSVALQRAGWGRRWWTASTDQAEAWARAGKEGARWISRSSVPKPGDMAIWDYLGDGTANHVSAVETYRADGKLVTIGGNEQNQCMRAVRSKTHLRGYIRLPFHVPTSTKSSHPLLGLGSHGPAVHELQVKLNKIMGANLVVDSDFGSKTCTAVYNLKRFAKLIPSTSRDCGVGPKTWATIDWYYVLRR